MLETNDLSRVVQNETDRLAGPAIAFTHPDEVLHACSLSTIEKRAVLAAWASDAHAVPNLPAMRQLDSGAIVSIDTVLAALRALDAFKEEEGQIGARRDPVDRSRLTLLSRWRRPLHRDGGNDDDDPPPCPVASLPPGLELELRRRRDAAWAQVAA